jgi:hypothetical protein
MSNSRSMHPRQVNVGGQVFKIGGSVLEKYPDSELGRAVKLKYDSHTISHFDRDAEIFKLIIDFIRYSSVSLKADDDLSGRMLIKDMEFFEIIPKGHVYLYDNESKFVGKYTWAEFKAKYKVVDNDTRAKEDKAYEWNETKA